MHQFRTAACPAFGWTSFGFGVTMGTMSASDAAPLPRLGEVFFDVRGEARTMRVSWYADTQIAVFSIWQGGTCTGTFRLPIPELPRMIEALQRGPEGAAGLGQLGAGQRGAQPPQAQRPSAPVDAAPATAVAGWGAGQQPFPPGQEDLTRAEPPGGPGYAPAPPPAHPAAAPAAGYPGGQETMAAGYQSPGPGYGGQHAAAAYPGQPGAEHEAGYDDQRTAAYGAQHGAGYNGADYHGANHNNDAGYSDAERASAGHTGAEHTSAGYSNSAGYHGAGYNGTEYGRGAEYSSAEYSGAEYSGQHSAAYGGQPGPGHGQHGAGHGDQHAAGYGGQHGAEYSGGYRDQHDDDQYGADQHGAGYGPQDGGHGSGASRHQRPESAEYPVPVPAQGVPQHQASRAGSAQAGPGPAQWQDSDPAHDGAPADQDYQPQLGPPGVSYGADPLGVDYGGEAEQGYLPGPPTETFRPPVPPIGGYGSQRGRHGGPSSGNQGYGPEPGDADDPDAYSLHGRPDDGLPPESFAYHPGHSEPARREYRSARDRS